jgi:hypothetical protein
MGEQQLAHQSDNSWEHQHSRQATVGDHQQGTTVGDHQQTDNSWGPSAQQADNIRGPSAGKQQLGNINKADRQ